MPDLKWIEWLVFYIMDKNYQLHPFWVIFGHQRTDIWPTWLQVKSYLKTTQINVYTNFEVHSFSGWLLKATNFNHNNCGPPDGWNSATNKKLDAYTYFWCKVNIWNVNCARATAFILDTRTGVLEKVSKFLRQKMSPPDGWNSAPNKKLDVYTC